MGAGFSMSRTDVSKLLAEISDAFSWRKRPNLMTTSNELTKHEEDSLLKIFDLDANDISADDWENEFDILTLLSPDAFCYYLSSILRVSVKENELNLIVVFNLVTMLNRSPNEDWWELSFLERWSLLTENELDAIGNWFYWMLDFQSRSISDEMIEKTLETLQILKKRKFEQIGRASCRERVSSPV